jgi:hypothetical protein
MSPDEPDEHEEQGGVLDVYDQAVGVALDVENDAIIREKVGGAEDRTHLSRAGPGGFLDHREPEAKGLLSIGVLVPKFDECVPAENPQLTQASMLPWWEQPATEYLLAQDEWANGSGSSHQCKTIVKAELP